MNIIKRGYTLAEVLITLAVIGTIATVTLPSLQTNAQRAQVVPVLQKAMNTLRNANQKILLENDARTLKSVCGKNYHTCLMDVTAGSSIINKYTTNNVMLTNNVALADNIVLSFHSTLQPHDGETDNHYQVRIDINGKKGPNRMAKDIFEFWIHSLTGEITASGNNGRWNSGSNNHCRNGEVPTILNYCTAAIIENGWQIKYKY